MVLSYRKTWQAILLLELLSYVVGLRGYVATKEISEGGASGRTVTCQVFLVEKQVWGRRTDQSLLTCETVMPLKGVPHMVLLDIHPRSLLAQRHASQMHAHEWFVEFSSAWIKDNNGILIVKTPTGKAIKSISLTEVEKRLGQGGFNSQGHKSRRLRKAFGENSVLLVRVSATDISPSRIVEEVKTAVTEASQQFSACSFGNFNLTLYDAIDVSLGASIGSFSSNSIYYNASAAVSEYYGLDPFMNPASALRVDHILYFVPFGLSDDVNRKGFGYAPLGGSYSVYQEAAFAAETIMHEIGHNLDLGHAMEQLPDAPDGDILENAEYGDDSGQMGSSYYLSPVNGLKRCYNGANFYELGWFADQTRDIAVVEDGTFEHLRLATFVDKNIMKEDQCAIVKIGNYFVTYNKQKGMNEGTKEYGNKLIIVEALQSGITDLKAILSLPGDGSLTKFVSDSLVVEVCGGGTDGAEYFDVVVGRNVGCEALVKTTITPNKHPTHQPIMQPTKGPTRSPTRRPPTKYPTRKPTKRLTSSPTRKPTKRPTTRRPTRKPTKLPTSSPTRKPTKRPTTKHPTRKPLKTPITTKTESPTKMRVTDEPSASPTTGEAATRKSHSPATTSIWHNNKNHKNQGKPKIDDISNFCNNQPDVMVEFELGTFKTRKCRCTELSPGFCKRENLQRVGEMIWETCRTQCPLQSGCGRHSAIGS